MNKTLLFVCLFTIIAAKAQVTLRPGLRAGANFASITDTGLDTKTDFYIGGFAALKISRFFTVQPEINYSRQGGKGPINTYVYQYDYNTGYDSSYYTTQNVSVDLQYVSLSIVNKFTFTDEINVHVGPVFDILANSPVYANADVDLGITAGVGYTLPFGLTVEARVKKGLVDVLDDYFLTGGYGYSDNYDNTTNLVFSIGASYSFSVTGSTK